MNGITLNIAEDTLDDTFGDSESIRNKFCGRRQLCEIMESAFSNGIAAEDLQMLYRKLLRATSQMHTKNGQRLFSVHGQNTKQVYTNGQIFHILVNGCSALYSFLAYLVSSDNQTGITEDNFPTRIFRDKKCLKRFKSLEDYERTGDIIFELMDEVYSDSERLAEKSDVFLITIRSLIFYVKTAFHSILLLENLEGNRLVSFHLLSVRYMHPAMTPL